MRFLFKFILFRLLPFSRPLRLVIFFGFGFLYFYGFSGVSLLSVFEPIPKNFSTQVVRVIDGDTLDIARIDPQTLSAMRLRLVGIDTPEKKGETACPIFADMAQRALEQKLLMKERQVEVRLLYRIQNRWLAAIKTADGASLSSYMLEQGLARRYFPRASHTRWPHCA